MSSHSVMNLHIENFITSRIVIDKCMKLQYSHAHMHMFTHTQLSTTYWLNMVLYDPDVPSLLHTSLSYSLFHSFTLFESFEEQFWIKRRNELLEENL